MRTKRTTVKTLMTGIVLLTIHHLSYGQDPMLPPTNLGITNLLDGNPPSSGWFYNQYVQSYQPDKVFNGKGDKIAGAPHVSSLVAMQQIVYLSNKKVAGGHFGFTVIVPVVKLSVNSTGGPAPSVNPDIPGDVVAGTMVQWFDRKLFGMKYSHRLEVDVALPLGSYDSKYDVNAGAHMWRVFPHYTFTLSPVKNLSFSMRHHLNYHFKNIGTQDRAGMSYNFNYSAEYAVTRSFFVEFAGYYLKQLEQDTHDGDHHFFQDKYGIPDTREQVFAYGPGIGIVFPTGLFLELKGVQETAVRNRSQGFKGTLALSYKLNKN